MLFSYTVLNIHPTFKNIITFLETKLKVLHSVILLSDLLKNNIRNK